MNIRTRRFTSLVLAGAILAGGAGGIGATSALAHDNGSASSAPRQQRDGHRGAPPAVTAAVKQLLNVDDAALKAARTAGTSLTALAKQKGVDRDTLVAAIASAMKANKPAGAPTLTDAQLTQMAGNIVDGVHPPTGPGGPGGRGGHRR